MARRLQRAPEKWREKTATGLKIQRLLLKQRVCEERNFKLIKRHFNHALHENNTSNIEQLPEKENLNTVANKRRRRITGRL